MKRGLLAVALLALVGGLVYWILQSAQHIEIAPWFLRYIENARSFYAEHRWLTVFLFCCAHVLAATLGIAGGCSLLNVASGAIFGFWQGCAIVYGITMVSAGIGYAIGFKFRATSLFERFRPLAENLVRHSRDHDYFYFVSLRLSPLLPFGLLNVMMGALAIPFGLFIMTTWIGIFFDVVLLNNVGAAAFEGSWRFVISFCVMLLALFWIRMVLLKQNQAEEI